MEDAQARVLFFELLQLLEFPLVLLDSSRCPVMKQVQDSDPFQLEQPGVPWVAQFPPQDCPDGAQLADEVGPNTEGWEGQSVPSSSPRGKGGAARKQEQW